ncbi:PadR family transcriptional regulator [Gemmata sp. G18]|uniref:PadR family transcriptional regulator n=1 Tax=Gemmata palustris TaxID=2822762 RepID=A0ABS5C0M5_9BACT|nr:PadR family transcriptional regulator [Gemmata palustris]MBP3959516.1 PadR family transcriptional regulator [Gemmata palustris]
MFGYFKHGRGGGDPRILATMAAHCRGRGGRHFGHRHGPDGRPEPDADEGSDFTLFEDGGNEMGRHGHGGRGREGWGFGWAGGHRGRGPAGRPLEQGDLRWLTLDLIAAQPRHGYEIIKAIADALSGHYTPSPGVIYPTLTLLEETGLIASEAQGPKKLYRLTDEGKAEVESHAADIQAAKARLAEANTRFGGAPAPELMRAMSNLRAALQVRLGKGPLTTEALNAITAALDRAAGEIERS